MQFEARLTGDAATLARPHAALLEAAAGDLPRLHPGGAGEVGDAVRRPSRRYQRALLRAPRRRARAGARALFAGLGRVEAEAGCDRIGARDPARFQDEAQALLRKRRLLTRWRREVDTVFQAVQPALDRAALPAGRAAPPGRAALWQRHRDPDRAAVEPLPRRAACGSADARRRARRRRLPRALFGGERRRRDVAVRRVGSEAGRSPLDAWIVDRARRCTPARRRLAAAPRRRRATGLSYERLRGYRDELTRALYEKIQTGVESPQAFAAYARSLTIAPRHGPCSHGADVMQAFVRDVFLTGNGTLFVNNTFVEWAAVQALSRAQPRLLVARYGVRDKMKPFSSLLLFSQPRASDQIPLHRGSGRLVRRRRAALVLRLAERREERRLPRAHPVPVPGRRRRRDAGRAIRPRPPKSGWPPASLRDVGATMAAWLGVGPPDPAGAPIDALLV